jgi:hypothetical protein
MNKKYVADCGAIARLICDNVKGSHPLIFAVDYGDSEAIVMTTKDLTLREDDDKSYIIEVLPTIEEWLEENGDGFVPNWEDTDQRKCAIYYDHFIKEFDYITMNTHQTCSAKHFSPTTMKKLMHALNNNQISKEGLI